MNTGGASLHHRAQPNGRGERAGELTEIHYLFESVGYGPELDRGETGQRTFDQSLIIDRAELIQQQIGVSPKFALSGNSETERFRVVNELGGKGNDQGGGMSGIEQRLGLDDEHGSGLSRFRPTARIQVGKLNLAALTHTGLSRWHQTPR